MGIWYRAHVLSKVEHVFSGEGGLFVAGRWNHKGRKVIYCSNSISLCTLEWLAHNGLSVSAYTYYKYAINIPDKLIQSFTVQDMPKGWKNSPSLKSTRDFAEINLFNQLKYIAISVPSVMVPEEFNLVINPLHKDILHIAKSIQKLGKYTAPIR